MRIPGGTAFPLCVAVMLVYGCGSSSSPSSRGLAGSGTVTGVVLDSLNGTLASGVAVATSDGRSTFTDAEGSYTLTGVNANISLILSAAPVGYTPRSQRLLPTSRSVFVPIAGSTPADMVLVGASPNTLNPTVAGVATATTIPGSSVVAQVSLRPNSLVLEGSAASPQGLVDAYIVPLNVSNAHPPGTKAGLDAFPGNMVGVATTTLTTDIATYGALAMEVRDHTSRGLVNLRGGASATITIPLPPGLETYAPATVPLWYYNRPAGVWIEEGNATRTGTAGGGMYYQGVVKHLGFWSASLPTAVCEVRGLLAFSDGAPVSGGSVTVSGAGYAATAVAGANGLFSVRARRGHAATATFAVPLNGGRLAEQSSLSAVSLAQPTHDMGADREQPVCTGYGCGCVAGSAYRHRAAAHWSAVTERQEPPDFTDRGGQARAPEAQVLDDALVVHATAGGSGAGRVSLLDPHAGGAIVVPEGDGGRRVGLEAWR
ncbi:hypothetical protein ACFL59_04645 [Planctomycetota bacterium]